LESPSAGVLGILGLLLNSMGIFSSSSYPSGSPLLSLGGGALAFYFYKFKFGA